MTPKRFDDLILEVFESSSDSFFYPIISQRQAKAFVKELHDKGVEYNNISSEIKETDEKFSTWRKGLSCGKVGQRVIKRINQPLQQFLEEETTNTSDNFESFFEVESDFLVSQKHPFELSSKLWKFLKCKKKCSNPKDDLNNQSTNPEQKETNPAIPDNCPAEQVEKSGKDLTETSPDKEFNSEIHFLEPSTSVPEKCLDKQKNQHSINTDETVQQVETSLTDLTEISPDDKFDAETNFEKQSINVTYIPEECPIQQKNERHTIINIPPVELTIEPSEDFISLGEETKPKIDFQEQISIITSTPVEQDVQTELDPTIIDDPPAHHIEKPSEDLIWFDEEVVELHEKCGELDVSEVCNKSEIETLVSFEVPVHSSNVSSQPHQLESENPISDRGKKCSEDSQMIQNESFRSPSELSFNEETFYDCDSVKSFSWTCTEDPIPIHRRDLSMHQFSIQEVTSNNSSFEFPGEEAEIQEFQERESYNSDLDVSCYDDVPPSVTHINEDIKSLNVNRTGPGYLYVFDEDVHSLPVALLKIGASRNPEKKFLQAFCFNTRLSLTAKFRVSNMELALKKTFERMSKWRIGDQPGWFEGHKRELLDVFNGICDELSSVSNVNLSPKHR